MRSKVELALVHESSDRVRRPSSLPFVFFPSAAYPLRANFAVAPQLPRMPPNKTRNQGQQHGFEWPRANIKP